MQVWERTCPTLADPPANNTWNCKDIDNYQCGDLENVFKVGFNQ